ncbi:MAG: hypothetical protein SVO01_00640 [Thermotogota bacterium]|nr:hypothetical protein [Thermotogota bacterium]
MDNDLRKEYEADLAVNPHCIDDGWWELRRTDETRFYKCKQEPFRHLGLFIYRRSTSAPDRDEWVDAQQITMSNKFYKALEKVTKEIMEMSQEEFEAKLEKHKDSDIAKIFLDSWSAHDKCATCQYHPDNQKGTNKHKQSESYPEPWMNCLIYLNPETGEMHSYGDHRVREWIQSQIINNHPDNLPEPMREEPKDGWEAFENIECRKCKTNSIIGKEINDVYRDVKFKCISCNYSWVVEGPG